MENNRMISIPSGDIAPAFPHSIPVGGNRMNVKHTNPTGLVQAQRKKKQVASA